MTWLSPARWILLLALVGAIIASEWAWARSIRADEHAKVVAEYSDKIMKQKAEAVTLLAAETGKAAATEKALHDFKNTQENTDAVAEKTVSILADKLHAAGRLRDPSATGCGLGGGGPQGQVGAAAGGSVGNAAQAGGLLSESLTRLLAELTRDADEINVAYASCRADAIMIRAALGQ